MRSLDDISVYLNSQILTHTSVKIINGVIGDDSIGIVRRKQVLSEGRIHGVKEVNLSVTGQMDDGETGFCEKICDKNCSFIDPVGDAVMRRIRMEKLYKSILTLNERERKFVLYHYGFDEQSACTVADTARHFGIRRSRVIDINSRIVCKLRGKQF